MCVFVECDYVQVSPFKVAIYGDMLKLYWRPKLNQRTNINRKLNDTSPGMACHCASQCCVNSTVSHN